MIFLLTVSVFHLFAISFLHRLLAMLIVCVLGPHTQWQLSDDLGRFRYCWTFNWEHFNATQCNLWMCSIATHSLWAAAATVAAIFPLRTQKHLRSSRFLMFSLFSLCCWLSSCVRRWLRKWCYIATNKTNNNKFGRSNETNGSKETAAQYLGVYSLIIAPYFVCSSIVSISIHTLSLWGMILYDEEYIRVCKSRWLWYRQWYT